VSLIVSRVSLTDTTHHTRVRCEQFVFSVVNADVFARIQELKNEACAHLMFVPVPRSPGIDPRHPRATSTPPAAHGFSLVCADVTTHTSSPAAASPLGRSKEEDVSPVDWSDPEQLKEFFGSSSCVACRVSCRVVCVVCR
jgi:hypothetical protein